MSNAGDVYLELKHMEWCTCFRWHWLGILLQNRCMFKFEQNSLESVFIFSLCTVRLVFTICAESHNGVFILKQNFNLGNEKYFTNQ